MEFFYIILMLVLVVIVRALKNKKRTYQKNSYPSRPNRSKTTASNTMNEHLRMVLKSDYRKQKLLNGGESKVYWAIIKAIRKSSEASKSAHVFAQTTIGEMLSSKEGYKAIMCKRVDICITDRDYYPIVAVEVNGQGHENDTDGGRDMIKKEALQKAGIKYLTVTTPISDDDLNRLIVANLIPLLAPPHRGQ